MSGVGFTASTFIAELGFAHHAEGLLMAEPRVLFASVVAGGKGYAGLWWVAARNGTRPVVQKTKSCVKFV